MHHINVIEQDNTKSHLPLRFPFSLFSLVNVSKKKKTTINSTRITKDFGKCLYTQYSHAYINKQNPSYFVISAHQPITSLFPSVIIVLKFQHKVFIKCSNIELCGKIMSP